MSKQRVRAKPKLASRRNLLHNWHLVNPINQRRQTTFTASGDQIWLDEWHLFRAKGEITASGVAITREVSAGTNGGISQHVEGTYIFGKEVTVSALIDGELFSAHGLVPTESGKQLRLSFGETWFVVQPNTAYAFVTIYFSDTETHVISAVKLEIGDTQTLAYKENGEWVLNDPPPDYGTELAKCQRYQTAIEIYNRIRIGSYFQNYLDTFVPLPVTMRAMPKIIDQSVFSLCALGGLPQSGFTFECVAKCSNGVLIRATKNAHGLTDGTLMTTGSTILDANL